MADAFVFLGGPNGAVRLRAFDTGNVSPIDGKPLYNLVTQDGMTASPSNFNSADASAADAQLLAASATQKNVISDLIVSVAAAMTVTIKEETTNNVLAFFNMAANTTVVFSPNAVMKQWTVNKRIMVRTSAAGVININTQSWLEF